MKFTDIPARLLERLTVAIRAHDDGLDSGFRLTSPCEDVIEKTSSEIKFMTPYNIGKHKVMAKIKIELEVI